MTEADTCRKFVVPLLQKAGWDNDPHSIAEQRFFTAGRIVSQGPTARRRPGKRADYLLRYTRDLPLAVVEAKAAYKHPADGLQQAKDYATILGIPFAYATNGTTIIEFDFTTGQERQLTDFPTPQDLWARYSNKQHLTDPSAVEHFLTPFNLTTGKTPHYYQRIAIDRVIQAILSGQRRVLVTMATGTGKTVVAFQICWKLWSSRWNRTVGRALSPQSADSLSTLNPQSSTAFRKPRILYLADRNFLVDDPKDKTFSAFGDARHKIEAGVVVLSRELYFATYQSLSVAQASSPASSGGVPPPFRYTEFPRDFFDLVIVDECHRGSAREESNWREILEWFEPAYQLGMTATPLRDENRDTYLYFGNPVYTYSLKQGIEDGFLAPYRVHRIVTQWDAAGWRPSKADLDRYGREIPDEVYTTADFERRVALRARTQAVARHLTDFLKKTDRFAKTIVFCVDQEHASEMRAALNNLNADLVGGHPRPLDGRGAGGEGDPDALPSHAPTFHGPYPDYVCRVTADEGDIGRGHMQRFQDVETRTPVILTTSQLLTTGLDAPTCRNVVLVRLVNSMVEFKQIIGRGTRVRDDYGKLTFNILDYTGTATRNFADPAFDGDPAFATQEEIDAHGSVKSTEILTPEEPESSISVEGAITEPTAPFSPSRPLGHSPRKLYFDGGSVEIAAELVHELDADGKQLRVVKLTDYTAEKVRTICTGLEDLRARWSDATERAAIIQQLADRGIDFQTVAVQAGKPDADPFDLLCHLAFNAPVLTRRQRADQLKKQQAAFFTFYAPEARDILNDLLEKYATDGEVQFTLPDVLKVPPISKRGNVAEIAKHFGGLTELGAAVSRLQSLLYAA